MAGLFPPVDPEAKRGRPRRRLVPFTAVLPNLVTLLGLCAGLTAIRMALEHRFDLAVAGIIFAIILDGIDGRLARYFRASSRFGEQLDSLADFVNFGVAPAIFVFVWRLDALSSFGWICALVFAICTGLRLARFNAALLAEEPRPDWHRDFFVGVPAPAGAGLVMLPFFLQRSNALDLSSAAIVVAIYTIVIALLMVSRLPTLSGKRFGQRIPRDRVLPVLVIGVLLVALLASYPFSFLATSAAAYLAHIPFAWRAWARAAARASRVSEELDEPDEPGD
jgi:CDP-diacylglycerol---serine O-phosphatidyltransferase